MGIIIGVLASKSSDSSSTSGSNSWPSPYPSPRPATYQYCNGKRTGGTPGWKDAYGDNCDWYANSPSSCSDPYGFAGSMGAAKYNCCVCIVSASPTPRPSYSWYSTPKPSPYLTPKSSPYPLSSCSDHTNKDWGTPGWKDKNGLSCSWYHGNYHNYRCKDFGNKWDGGMGTAK